MIRPKCGKDGTTRFRLFMPLEMRMHLDTATLPYNGDYAIIAQPVLRTGMMDVVILPSAMAHVVAEAIKGTGLLVGKEKTRKTRAVSPRHEKHPSDAS